jgi:hypothetical protein
MAVFGLYLITAVYAENNGNNSVFKEKRPFLQKIGPKSPKIMTITSTPAGEPRNYVRNFARKYRGKTAEKTREKPRKKPRVNAEKIET